MSIYLYLFSNVTLYKYAHININILPKYIFINVNNIYLHIYCNIYVNIYNNIYVNIYLSL